MIVRIRSLPAKRMKRITLLWSTSLSSFRTTSVSLSTLLVLLLFTSPTRSINRIVKIAIKKNFYRKLPVDRRKTAKKYHDQFTLVYRKEGEIVVETNPEIDPCGGRDGADLYLEREVKTYNLVDEVCWRVPNEDSPDHGFLQEEISYKGFLSLKVVSFIAHARMLIWFYKSDQKYEINCDFQFIFSVYEFFRF